MIVSDIFSCKTGRAKIDNPMKGQHIGVMLTNGKAPAFGKCRAAHGNDIIPIELPVGVLESVEKQLLLEITSFTTVQFRRSAEEQSTNLLRRKMG